MSILGKIVSKLRQQQEQELKEQFERERIYEPHKLRDRAFKKVLKVCSELIEQEYVNEWEMRGIMQELTPLFGKTKYVDRLKYLEE